MLVRLLHALIRLEAVAAVLSGNSTGATLTSLERVPQYQSKAYRPCLHRGTSPPQPGQFLSRESTTADVFSAAKRSEVMSRVRSRGNASTELRVIQQFRIAGIVGWRRHLSHVPGSPDFVFPRQRVALHVHGCFWHGCTRCNAGKLPKANRTYWESKIARNVRRDRRNRDALRRAGYRTVQVWEHDLLLEGWLRRLRSLLL
ncbi:MAG TPA: hypothetical protein DCQ33_16345 [Nitrospira sp.]|nr:hypothetical protein [Nitrospira sp.]